MDFRELIYCLGPGLLRSFWYDEPVGSI